MQNRQYGPYLGVDTTKPPLAKLPGAAGVGIIPVAMVSAETGSAALFKKENCSACHASAAKLVGPSIEQVATKYKGQTDALAKLITKVKKGGSGVWGAIPMPAQDQLSDADAKALVEWMLTGK